MASPGQKRGALWTHITATFDQHSRCACCKEKGQGYDPCVNKQDCKYCNMLASDQISQLSTPTYKAGKYKKSEKLVTSPSPIDTGSGLILG